MAATVVLDRIGADHHGALAAPLPAPLGFGATVRGCDVCYVDWGSPSGETLAAELRAALTSTGC